MRVASAAVRQTFMWPGLNACLTLLIRWVKTAAELALLRKSAAISAEAMARCMRLTRASVSEAVLAATFGACEAFRLQGMSEARRHRT